jgi:hypothetical protein
MMELKCSDAPAVATDQTDPASLLDENPLYPATRLRDRFTATSFAADASTLLNHVERRSVPQTVELQIPIPL